MQTAGKTTTLNGDITVDGTDLTFARAVIVGADITIDTDGSSTDGDITFSSTVNGKTVGGESLTLDAATGDVTLSGAAGGTKKLDDLTITGAAVSLKAVTLGGGLTVTASGQVDLDAVTTVDGISVTGSNIDLNAANYRSDDGDITFTGASTSRPA